MNYQQQQQKASQQDYRMLGIHFMRVWWQVQHKRDLQGNPLSEEVLAKAGMNVEHE